MTVLPTPRPSDRWLLNITIQAAHADDTRWNQQLAVLRSVSTYEPGTQTWSTRIGVLDLTTLSTLQTLFDAARTFGTEIHIEPAPVPNGWPGPSFKSGGDVAALLIARADERRPLGQLPIT
ncbi:hypothetical protein DMH26_28560 [Streptomyces sp. WAC 05379]|uniref:hypothetical protein n=1 Tax=Streptomyces sp. WAC 05379 TaxID=2203207 RepID=UPI000F7381CE|nr:hypothetical protein [Streptomyces sp. WAC 05379]RSN90112.1 hypothetical protein DMH26_28560 [Streptomyces sp. WAC 05379]